MLNRETNKDILGIYKKTSENALKFSYFGEVHNGSTQIHSLPTSVNASYKNSMILHSGSAGIGTDISVAPPMNAPSSWTSNITMKQLSSIIAAPNYINVTSSQSISKSLLSFSNNINCSVIVQIDNVDALTSSEGVLIVDSTTDTTQTPMFIAKSSLASAFVNLGNNIYVLNAYYTIDFSADTVTEIKLPFVSLADSSNGFNTSTHTTLKYFDACLVVDAK